MPSIWPYFSLLVAIGVILVLLGFTVVFVLALLEKALVDRSRLIEAAFVSTFSIVLLMAILGAVTATAAERSDGRLQTWIAATLVGLAMLAIGIKGAVQTVELEWSQGFKFTQVLLGLLVYTLVVLQQPQWLIVPGGVLLSLVHWLIGVPVFGWLVALTGGVFVIWTVCEMLQFFVVLLLALTAKLTRRYY